MRLTRILWISLIILITGLPAVSVAREHSRNFAAKSTGDAENAGGAARSSHPAKVWLGFYRGETKASYAAIAAFIKAHPDFPGMNKLREEAEKAMPSSVSDAEALAWFDKNPPQTTFGMKTYALAMKRAGREKEAIKKINEWWRDSNLTPNDQSKAYMAFATVLDKSSHERRLSGLIYRQQYTNARALAEALGSGHKALTEARISMRSGKGNPNTYLNRIPDSLQGDEGLLFDRLRFRRKQDNNAGAIEILNKSPSYEKMYDAEEWGKERAIIVRRLFEEQKFGLAYKLASDHRIKSGNGFAQNEWMAGWLALEYLKKPWEAFEHFERLYHNVETPISRSRAAYWAGLASERLGHPEVARKWYEVGAKHATTFYGQLSSAKLGRDDRVPTTGASPSNLKNGELAAAARWLKQNGYKTEARMFFNKLIETARTPGDYAAVAEAANAVSMKNVAIRAAQECEKKNGTTLVGYAFPKIEKYMNDVDVEWALVHALVRQESRYDAEAVSSAGARGLMQLMPGTAKEVARKAGLSHQTDWLTKKPGHNVELGTRYLKKLLNKYNGNYAMALAAYNAGPSRVDRWIVELGDPRTGRISLVNWIEMIPIYETRNYVQRVLEGVYVYRQTLSTNKGRTEGGIRMALQ
jgi:soluble lytic murein transglycosylase